MARGGQTIAHPPWMWLAREARRRQGMAVHGGARRRRRAQRLWAQRPQAYRPPATCSPAPSGGYASVLLAAQPRTIRTWARQTPPSERCHNPRRQRVARWGREALAGSNNRAQPIGASTLCICHDNLTSATAEIEPYMDSTTILRATAAVARRQGLAHGRSSHRRERVPADPRGTWEAAVVSRRGCPAPVGGVRCCGDSYRRLCNGPS